MFAHAQGKPELVLTQGTELRIIPPMSQQLRYLEGCIRDAQNDEQAAALLRAIIKGAAESAPVDALIEIGQSLVTIRKRDARMEAERN